MSTSKKTNREPVTPWWQAMALRKEIITGSGQVDDVQMSLYNAVYRPVGSPVPYADASYYGAITYPTGRLTALLTSIAIRLGGGENAHSGTAVTRLDQGMGGGKSHACIGAYHLAANPAALLATDLGESIQSAAHARIGRRLPDDLGNPHVVVLACDNMTPFEPDPTFDGKAITLYERFLWRLFDGDHSKFDRYKSQFSSKAAIGEAIGAIGRPVLIIIDEIVDYIGNGLDGANRPDLTAQDMAFLRALLDVVNDIENTALIMVMIDSESDSTALSPAADQRRADVHALLVRNGTTTTVTEVSDFAEILRRRLFEQPPVKELVAGVAAEYAEAMNDESWRKNVWQAIDEPWRKDWDQYVADCYPFHPMLIGIARKEWAQITGFQRVRSTIRIFAATVYALQQRGLAGGWVPQLIGPGDLPLSDNAVREALLYSGLMEEDRTRGNYRSLAENEIVNSQRSSGVAWSQDHERDDGSITVLANPHPAERAATFIFLASIIGTLRPGGRHGASAIEVKAATAVPDTAYTHIDAELVVAELVGEGGLATVETVPGHGRGRPARYFMSTRLTYKMRVNNIKATITDDERDQVIAERAKKLVSSGPFSKVDFVWADQARKPWEVLATHGIDDAHQNRLVVLDPAQFSLRNGMEEATVTALTSAMGLDGTVEKQPAQWASSAVFAVVNTQRRAMARRVAKEYLARKKALADDEIQNDESSRQEGQKELDDADRELTASVKKAYQHVAFLAQPDPDGPRQYVDLDLDEDNLTALDGAAVWKALAGADKALDAGQLTTTALLHNLRDRDFGRSLAEIRDAFYNAPRLPLLYGRDVDLKKAIYDAVAEEKIRIVDGAGQTAALTAPEQVNLTSATLRLEKVLPRCATCGQTEENEHQCPEPAGPGAGGQPGSASADSGAGPGAGDNGDTGPGGKGAVPGGGDAGGSDPEPVREKKLQMSFSQSLLGNEDMAEGYGRLFRSLYLATDEADTSFLQGTITLIVGAVAADKIVEEARTLGITLNIQDS